MHRSHATDHAARLRVPHAREPKHQRLSLSPVAVPTRLHAVRGNPRQRWWSALLPLILLSGLLMNWVFTAQDVFAAPVRLSSAAGTMTLQQFQQENMPVGQGRKIPQPGPDLRLTKSEGKQGQSRPSMEPATMQDLNYLLDDSFVIHRPTMRSSTQPEKMKGTAIPAETVKSFVFLDENLISVVCVLSTPERTNLTPLSSC